MVRQKHNLIFRDEHLKIPNPKCITKDINVLRDLKFGSLNCNSLNISTHNKDSITIDDFNKKIVAFLKQKCDLIFLQDIRLNAKLEVLNKAVRCTPYGNYVVYSNSYKSKRGVCINYPHPYEYFYSKRDIWQGRTLSSHLSSIHKGL